MDKIMLKAIQMMFKFLGLPGKEYLVNQVFQKIQPIIGPLLEHKEMKLKPISEEVVEQFDEGIRSWLGKHALIALINSNPTSFIEGVEEEYEAVDDPKLKEKMKPYVGKIKRFAFAKQGAKVIGLLQDLNKLKK